MFQAPEGVKVPTASSPDARWRLPAGQMAPSDG
jgi:hypothetical protein